MARFFNGDPGLQTTFPPPFPPPLSLETVFNCYQHGSKIVTTMEVRSEIIREKAFPTPDFIIEGVLFRS
jgi:hypothetical protein